MFYIYCVYDSLVGNYKEPFAVPVQGGAIREFAEACNTPNSFIANSPMDYSLFYVGTFDENTCSFELLPAPQRVACAADFVRKSKEVSSS